MFMPSHKSVEGLTRPANDAFRFWISFWPVAPLFGVEYRFADLTKAVTPGVGPKPSAVAREAVKAQTRAVEEIAAAPSVAEPVADEALEASVALTERAIEETLEPVAPSAPAEEPAAEPKVELKQKAERKAEAEPKPEPEAAVEDVAQSNLDLETAEEAAPRKPRGLLSSAPKKVDDLKQIKGIGPGLESQLNGLGIYTFKQIAGFSEQDLSWVDQNLSSFKGKCFRDDWIGQAKAQIG